MFCGRELEKSESDSFPVASLEANGVEYSVSTTTDLCIMSTFYSKSKYIRLVVLPAVKKSMLIFWVDTSASEEHALCIFRGRMEF